MSKEVILTGLRSNGTFHLGNYLGAIQPIIKLQSNLNDEMQINMFIPDLHSFTTPVDHTALYSQSITNIKIYVALGLDINNKNTFIYRQSCVSAHSELAWILSCFTHFGELRRMTQFKDKSDTLSSDDDSELLNTSVSVGLFNYPVLMAADILLYDAKWVPVGEDQRQHLELARDLAIRINNKFGDIFTVPNNWEAQLKYVNRVKGARIRSLKNPTKKMSKSVEDPSGTINLDDNPDEAFKKIMSATTDSVGAINYDWDNQPGISNLLQILSLIDGVDINEIIARWTGLTSYGDLKNATAEKVKVFLEDFQSKLEKVDEDNLISVLEKDEITINIIANEKLLKIQKSVGLRSNT